MGLYKEDRPNNGKVIVEDFTLELALGRDYCIRTSHFPLDDVCTVSWSEYNFPHITSCIVFANPDFSVGSWQMCAVLESRVISQVVFLPPHLFPDEAFIQVLERFAILKEDPEAKLPDNPSKLPDETLTVFNSIISENFN